MFTESGGSDSQIKHHTVNQSRAAGGGGLSCHIVKSLAAVLSIYWSPEVTRVRQELPMMDRPTLNPIKSFWGENKKAHTQEHLCYM